MSLKIKNLVKSFENKKVFAGFSYDFPDKGLFLLRGDSGVGKTTLFRIIAGLDKSFDGAVVGGGIPNVSYAFQEYRLFPELTALENTMIASPEESNVDMARATATLALLGFTDEEMHLLPSELSGGMKQRVSLARAFLKQCPILLLDEPTKELDENLCEVVRKIVSDEALNRLVIMITHKSEDADKLLATEIRI